MTSAHANRGKETEKEVQAFLTKFSSQRAAFDWERLPDARSAMGRVKAQVADFAFFGKGFHGVIEAKETEHDFRLTRDKISQLAKLRLRAVAGGICIVIVCHSKDWLWRVPPIDHLLTTDGASWDLRAFPIYETAEQALRTFPVFQI